MEQNVTALNDTLISELNPSNTYEGRPTLTVRNVTGKRLFAFIMARGITPRPGAVVVEAFLRLYPTENFASTTFIVKRPAKSWTASSLRWNNRPDPGPTVVEHTAAGVKEKPFDVPITAEVAGWLAGTVPNSGLRIETTTTDAGGRHFHSVNASGTKAAFKPSIVMKVSFPPAAPSDIAPSGGAQVSTPNPIATWRYVGGEGVGEMAAYQVQTFGDDVAEVALGGVLNERFATWNINGNLSTPIPFNTRVNAIAAKIVESDASVVALQEANTASTVSPTNQPGAVRDALHALGATGWEMTPVINLNAFAIDTTVWDVDGPVIEKRLGAGAGDSPQSRYAIAIPLTHKATGTKVTGWTAHFIPSPENEPTRIAHTKVLVSWLASLPGVKVGMVDLNSYSFATGSPLSRLALAGHLTTRSLVDDVTNGQYASTGGYGTPSTSGRWIDQVLVSGGPMPTGAGLILSEGASDHHLIYADVQYASAMQTAGELGTPTSDTGEVPSQIPQHQFEDVSGDVTARFRHKSIDNVWSNWSQPVTFGYTPLPTITITSNESTTSDPSPTTTWTVDGTQRDFQVIYRRVDTGEVVTDSGVVSGDEGQWQPPKPVQVGAGVELTRTVRVWDDVNRMPTLGEPVYVEATSGPFTIVPDAEIAPATSVSVTQEVGPNLSLAWKYAITADSWLVDRRVGDQPVRRYVVESGDVAVGNGWLNWHDVTAPMEHDVSYRVIPVMNGRLGPASSWVAIRPRCDFIWLADPEDPDWLVPLAGRDEGSFVLAEDSTVVNVKGSDRSILIHEGFRGYEGSVTGSIHSDLQFTDGASAQDYRSRIWDTKRKPTKVWRLVVSDINIPVVLRNVNVTPTPGPTLWYGASAEFLQQGELAWVDQ